LHRRPVPKEKFLAWARTVPQTLRNPLYHWTHLELKRYFGIDELLNESSGERIWDQANAMLGNDDLRPQGIMQKFHVKGVCTTDDPVDDLSHHRALAAKGMAASGMATKVYPAFRPDQALNVHLPERLNLWLGKLEAAANMSVATLTDLVEALRKRHDFFHHMGGRLSDHGLNTPFADFGS
jgi:glucuronate isomerase